MCMEPKPANQSLRSSLVLHSDSPLAVLATSLLLLTDIVVMQQNVTMLHLPVQFNI